MPPVVKREAIVVVLDVSASSSQLDTDGVSYLDKAKQCLSWIIKRKILSTSKDEIGIILLGSEETNNALADDDFSNRYENISVLTENLSMATWDMLRQVNKVYGTSVDKADWLDAIVVAMDFLKHFMEGKVFSESKIVVLSKFTSEVQSDEQVSVIVKTIDNMNINLVVIGPDSSGEDSQNQNVHLIAQIVRDTKDVICSYDEALTQLRFYNKESKKPMPWNVCLTIGPDVKIPVVGYKKIDGTLNLGWKTQSEGGEHVVTDHAFFKQDETIERKDIIAGYTFGSTIVPFSEVEKQTMSYQTGEKCLSALGFTSLSLLPKHLFIGDTVNYFLPRKNDCHAAIAFTALIKALEESKLAIIVRKVYRAGCSPMIGAMLPKIDANYCMLLFLELPYAEDFKDLILPQLCNVKPTEQQYKCIDKLITAMDLTDPEILEEDEEPYVPEKLINPFKQHVDHCIVLKALDKNQSLPNEPEKIIQDLLKPLPVIAKRSKVVLQEVKKLFPLEIQVSKTKKKEAAVVFNPDRKAANLAITDKTEIDKGASMTDLMKSSIHQISTVNPVSDFQSIVKSGIPFATACKQMQSIIIKLFIMQADDGAKKTLSALAVLRQECINEAPEDYNSWLGSLKDIILEKGKYTFWDAIVQENFGLITKLESEKSNIGIEEAKIFEEIKIQEPESNGFDEAMDAEDLLDMM